MKKVQRYKEEICNNVVCGHSDFMNFYFKLVFSPPFKHEEMKNCLIAVAATYTHLEHSPVSSI